MLATDHYGGLSLSPSRGALLFKTCSHYGKIFIDIVPKMGNISGWTKGFRSISPMVLTGTDKLDEFVKRLPQARSRIQAWRAEAQRAKWTKPLDIKNRYRSVDFRPGNHVIFDIGGNKYRLFVQVSYQLKIVRVAWVGTHAEYDRKQF